MKMENSGRVIAFGKYQLTGKTLGEGSFAKVKEAIDCNKRRRVALKIMDLTQIESEYIKKCCFREANILAKLDHPNVIRMLDCFKTTRHYVIVMEIMPTNLCQYIENPKICPFKEYKCRIVLRQIAKALSYLHSKHIVHRDVKLDNILIEPLTYKAKLTGKSGHNQ